MILESDVREKLAAVARGALSLEQFADWIEDESWNMHSDSFPDAVDLVSSIHLLLSERDDRVLDDVALRAELVKPLNNVHVSAASGPFSASNAYWVNPEHVQVWALPVSA